MMIRDRNYKQLKGDIIGGNNNKNLWLRKISEKLGIKNYLSESKVSERS